MDIRQRIRQIMAQHPDWTVRGISLKAGLSDSALSKFLNPDKAGGIKSLTLDKMEALAEAMNVNPRWLVFGDYPIEPDPKVISIWDRINDKRREQALQILETFADKDKDQSDVG